MNLSASSQCKASPLAMDQCANYTAQIGQLARHPHQKHRDTFRGLTNYCFQRPRRNRPPDYSLIVHCGTSPARTGRAVTNYFFCLPQLYIFGSLMMLSLHTDNMFMHGIFLRSRKRGAFSPIPLLGNSANALRIFGGSSPPFRVTNSLLVHLRVSGVFSRSLGRLIIFS